MNPFGLTRVQGLTKGERKKDLEAAIIMEGKKKWSSWHSTILKHEISRLKEEDFLLTLLWW
jgi:hypothetical protein